MSWMDDFTKGFNEAVGEGREEWRQSFFEGRSNTPILDGKGKKTGKLQDMTDAPRAETTLNTNPTIQRFLDNAGAAIPGFQQFTDNIELTTPQQRAARERMGLGLKKTGAGRTGQMAGTLVNDVLNDNTRAIWWLINAPQAVVNIANEEALARNYNILGMPFGNADLFASETITETMPDGSVRPYPRVQPDDLGGMDVDELFTGRPDFTGQKDAAQKEVNYQRALEYEDKERGLKGLIDPNQAKPKKGIGLDRQGNYTRRVYSPGHVAMLGAPAGVAINAGLGLLNPLGGNEGYEAVFADPSDPSKTTNPIMEIAAKYILGRTGNLQNWDDFKEARPDVSKEEYNRYKAYKYDKGLDLNITDGDFNLGGVLKGTTDGIHGPEVQFLGRTIPVLTTMLPTAGAILGTGFGVARSRGKLGKERTAIRDGLIGGTAGLAVTSAAGMIAEEARRRAGSVSSQELTEYQS